MTTRAEKINLLEAKLSVLSDIIEKGRKPKKSPSTVSIVFSTIFFLFIIGLFLIAWGPIGLIPVLALATITMFILKATGIIKGRHPLFNIAYIIILIAAGAFIIGILFSLSIPGAIMSLIILVIAGGAWRGYKENHKVH